MTVDEAAKAEGVLAAFAFGAPFPEAMAAIDLPQLGPDYRLVEVWRTDADVTCGRQGAICWAATDDVVFGTLALDGEAIEAAGATAFDAIIDFARSSGRPNLLRVWNHVGDINQLTDGKQRTDGKRPTDGSGGTERYRAFCAGRYEAFARHGYALRADLPAASAVGMRGRRYAVYFLASKTPGVQVENPRQVSAYDYPPQYGRRSPSFSRATLLRGSGESLLFLAGTSSIVGHETRHAGDVAAQAGETILNVSSVLQAAGATTADVAALKVYVRNPADLPVIEGQLRASFSAPMLFLHADICRGDLLVEVEGVARVKLRPA
jgi:chorismate lyase/3-hydroxybenzoate synthase